MAIRVALNHKTRYRYDRPVTLNPHVVRLRPAPHCRTPILSYSLKVEPVGHFINWQQDPFNNHQARLVFPRPARELSVEVDLVAELVVVNPFDFFVEDYAQLYPFRYETSLALELTPYFEVLPPEPLLVEMVEILRGRHVRQGHRNVDVLVDVNRQVRQRLTYDIRMEPGVFSPEETLRRGHGSCRDFAWLTVQLLRNLGYAARFVSGYSIQLKADVAALDGPSGVAADCTDLHAWVEAYLPGAGWIGLDPTSGLLAGEGYIPLACTAIPSSAAPITGSYAWDEREVSKVAEEFSFDMTVTRIAEQPRVTKPFRDDEWVAISALGRAVDRDLSRDDVRLTMGGEPTFVSIDDVDGAEWSTEATGPAKRIIADRLIRRLRDRFAPGGILHFGQGKWYPGEPLPRWAFSCYFRRDGEPVWRDPALVAGTGSGEPRNADSRDAEQFIRALARRLGVAPALCIAAFEDVWYYLWRERRLPVNVDPLRSRLEDPEERARLARIFEEGVAGITGYALPLRAISPDAAKWESGRWPVRSERLYLLPGDSPMGFRLPLDSLTWEPPADRDQIHERDPGAPRPALARAATPSRISLQPRAAPKIAELEPASPTSKISVIRTALCVEARSGVLHIFLPPTGGLEDYLELVTAVEDVARELSQPVRVEGYHPPTDHRLNKLQVTPDPGVIEVNVQPAHSWDELCAITTTLYEEARQCHLGTEKFMVDGRHTGTGGGNHMVVGGATPADSPFLRRPDLLRSLVSYWLNHPSLSYLFSGLFTGPTSQAPRVDEARHDSLAELEIAFSQIPMPGAGPAPPPPWLVDRIFRHILADVTGNTHRTEFCIDKLYSPDSATGRLGLLELRAFEMPPHAQMSLTQQLVLRALVAWFWRQPYTARLVRWGTGLVDRFSLPHFVVRDFEDVLADLRGAGYPFDSGWFRTHQEFRFPFYGTVTAAGVTVELRQALEPWHVLGEEPAGGGTTRFVDSSVERVQVKVLGMTDSRHVVACNGRRVPLQPTGTPGESVAGVRFRAWQPPSALHPTIGVHAPLVFDIIDIWTGRAVGGCTYHVSHPGGRAHDTRPTTSFEAEGRRAARFFAFGHTPGAIEAPPAEHNRDFPHTLDLRRAP